MLHSAIEILEQRAMSMIDCPDCKCPVSTEQSQCVNCGYDPLFDEGPDDDDLDHDREEFERNRR